MAKYIKLEDVIKTYADSKMCKHIFKKKGLDLVERFFADLPTIEIVHCKDCRWQDDCSQVVENIEGTAGTQLRWCSDGYVKDIYKERS